jgi:hypothetical protein
MMSIRISLPQLQWYICFSHSDILDPTTSCRSIINSLIFTGRSELHSANS